MSYTPSGKAVTKFSLAVSRRRRDRDSNEMTKETTWFSVVAWEQLAERCNQYLHKGSKVYIEGRMTSRKYTNKDGIEMTVWDVVAENMEMLDSRPDSQGSAGSAEEMDPDNLPF
jgi:single-strand DNA-binding protein